MCVCLCLCLCLSVCERVRVCVCDRHHLDGIIRVSLGLGRQFAIVLGTVWYGQVADTADALASDVCLSIVGDRGDRLGHRDLARVVDSEREVNPHPCVVPRTRDWQKQRA